MESTNINILPTEILQHCFCFLDKPIDLARSGRVNKNWHLVSSNNLLWNKFVHPSFSRKDQHPVYFFFKYVLSFCNYSCEKEKNEYANYKKLCENVKKDKKIEKSIKSKIENAMNSSVLSTIDRIRAYVISEELGIKIYSPTKSLFISGLISESTSKTERDQEMQREQEMIEASLTASLSLPMETLRLNTNLQRYVLVLPEDREAILETIRSSLEERKLVPTSYTFLIAQNDTRWELLSLLSEKDGNFHCNLAQFFADHISDALRDMPQSVFALRETIFLETFRNRSQLLFSVVEKWMQVSTMQCISHYLQIALNENILSREQLKNLKDSLPDSNQNKPLLASFLKKAEGKSPSSPTFLQRWKKKRNS